MFNGDACPSECPRVSGVNARAWHRQSRANVRPSKPRAQSPWSRSLCNGVSEREALGGLNATRPWTLLTQPLNARAGPHGTSIKTSNNSSSQERKRQPVRRATSRGAQCTGGRGGGGEGRWTYGDMRLRWRLVSQTTGRTVTKRVVKRTRAWEWGFDGSS